MVGASIEEMAAAADKAYEIVHRNAHLRPVIRFVRFPSSFPLPLLPLCRHPPSNSKKIPSCPLEKRFVLLYQNTWASGR